MWTFVNLDVHSMYGTGCARSDLTTCLPVPWGGWGPLVRSKQAVFLVLDFELISVSSCLATAVETIRTIQAGSNLAHWSFHARCPRRICVGWRQTFFFWLSGVPKRTWFTTFQSLGICWRMGQMHHKLAQYFCYGRLLNLFFGSSQLDNWLQKYGRFKYGVVKCSKIVFTLGLHALTLN